MTNCAMVLPQPGFHEGLREITRRHGTLLLIDETHTLSTGPGGYTRRHGLSPDLFVVGKAIAGGVPAAVWGMSEETAARFKIARSSLPPGHSGIGTTLSGSPFQLAALRATLEQVATEAAYAHMEALADRMEAGLAAILIEAGLPWHVARCGARVEIVRAPDPLSNGAEARARALSDGGDRDPSRAAGARRADLAVPRHDAGLPRHQRGTGRPSASARCAR